MPYGRYTERKDNDENNEDEIHVGTGFWDTFRALFPLLNFAYPEVNALMTEGLENSWKEAGWFPEWSSPGLSDCMTGNNSASVIADAWLSGARGNADAETLWQGLVHGANNQHPKQGATGRWGVADYNSLGYVAHDHGRHGTVARTLEYAYDDWCIWRFGKAIGGRLVFRMSSKPVKTRGTTLAAAPYSMSKEEKK